MGTDVGKNLCDISRFLPSTCHSVAHVAFLDSFTNHSIVTFNEHYFAPDARTICRRGAETTYSTAPPRAFSRTDDSPKKKKVFILSGYIFNTIKKPEM